MPRSTPIFATMPALALAVLLCQPANANPAANSGDTIAKYAINSEDHSTLVAAAQAAGLVEALEDEGPFTVFGPTNGAFARIEEASLERLLQPAHRPQLRRILTCHIVESAVLTDALRAMIDDQGGVHSLQTLGGCTLAARMDGDALTVTDQNGRVATVTVPDIEQFNGVIHVIDRVMLPAG